MKRLVKMFVLITVILIFVVPCIGKASTESGVGGQKDETDVILGSFREAAKSVDNLKGLEGAKKVAVLVIRQGGEKAYELEGKYVNVPSGSSSEHNPMIEDLIIDQLMEIGGYTIVEISKEYYGSLHSDLNYGIGNDLDKIKSIGEAVGADTVIIGSSAGTILKKVTKKSFLGLSSKTYFVSNVKLNLRTVEVKSGTVTSTVIGSGSDSVKVSSTSMVALLLLPLSLILIGL